MPYTPPKLSPDETELIEREALRNFRACFPDDPVQLHRLSVRLLELHEAGFGELRLTWDSGHPSSLTLTTSDWYMSLPLPGFILQERARQRK